MASAVFPVAGICVKLVPIPPKRSEQLTREGKIDGELMRTLVWVGMNSSYVVAVPTPIVENRMLAVSLKHRGYLLKVLEDMRGLDVVVFGGHRWAESKVEEIGIKPQRVNSMARFYELIRRGGASVGLIEDSVLGPFRDKPEFQMQKVGRVGYHIVLLQKHKGLVGALDKAVRRYISVPPH